MVVLLAAALALAFAPTARADYFGNPYMDDSTMDFYYSSSLPSAIRSSLELARTTAIEPTDVTTKSQTSYATSRDVWVIIASPKCPPYGTIASCEANRTTDPFYSYPTAYAVTVCLKKVGTKCDQSRVAINALNSHSNYRSVGCHEFGHVLGFKDGQNDTYGTNSTETNSANQSCMRSRPDWNYYSHDHDWTHINAKY